MGKLGKLDENSLQRVMKEFNRCKKGTDYRYFRITDYIDSGRFARVYSVEGIFGGKLGGRFAGKKYALRIADADGSDKNGLKNFREQNTVKQLMQDGEKHVVDYLMTFTVETEFGVKYCTLMPYLCTLSKYKNTSDDMEIAVRCGCDLLPLLQKCMEKKIIHRDIKPQNIFFDGDFRNERGLLLGDFGEARWDSDGTVSSIGTPATVSPEIACFDDDIKNEHRLCDMYSLGIVMYYYLNNRTYPFGNYEAAYRKRMSTKETLPPPQSGSERLKRLVLRATQYYPSKRFSSPQEMLNELKQCEEYARFMTHTQADDSSEETWKLDRFKADQIARLRAENNAFREKAARREQELRAQIERLKRQNAQQMRDQRQPSRPPEKSAARRTAERMVVHVGDRLLFGSYPQTASGDTESLVWRVLDVREGMALIITEKLIDYRRFHDKLTEVTWEDCTLRGWLNGEFMTKAFGSLHPARVLPVTNRNDSVQNPGFSNFHPTRDQVFVLSAEEAKRYFASKEDRMAFTTDYAHTQKFDFDDRSDDWWLRSAGVNNRIAVCVNHDGDVRNAGRDVNYYNVAVRPALWLKL